MNKLGIMIRKTGDKYPPNKKELTKQIKTTHRKLKKDGVSIQNGIFPNCFTASSLLCHNTSSVPIRSLSGINFIPFGALGSGALRRASSFCSSHCCLRFSKYVGTLPKL
jgi:hypothetical protein